MGVIRTAYNIFMTLIGLAVICIVAFFFLVGKWENYQEEKYDEAREEIASAVEQAARERGLGDLSQLRRGWARCHAPHRSAW